MIQRNQYIFIIMMFFTVVYLLPLGTRPLMVPDETRYAEIPREMVVSGDWVVPRLNGLKYYEKPIMGYWVHALFQKGLGESDFVVRLPSALSTGLVAFLIFYMLASVMGRQDSRVYLAPLVFLSSFGVFGMGTIAILDNVLNFFITASLVLFFIASEKESRSNAEKVLLLLAGISVGCAFMTKGFLAFVVPVITVIPYLLWHRRAKEIVRLLTLPALAAVVISLPWSIMIHLRDPDFWNFFFWHEHVRRFFSDDAQHSQPFYFYLVTIIPLFLPWIFLLPSACKGLSVDINDNQKIIKLMVFCICWLVFPLLFFSVSNGKLATYILPCFSPLAILSAIGLYGIARTANRSFSFGLSIFIVLISLGLVAFIGSQLLGLNVFSLSDLNLDFNVEELRYSEDLWKPFLVSASLIFMGVLCFWALRCKNGEKKLILVALSPTLFLISSFLALPDTTLTSKAPGLLFEEEVKNIPSDSIVLVDASSVRAACWYLKRTDLVLIGYGGELKYALEKPEGQDRVLGFKAIRQLIETNNDKEVVILLRNRHWDLYRNQFPDPRDFVNNGKDGYAVVRY